MGNNNIISKIRAHFNIMPDKEDEQEIISQITSGISFRGANLWVLIFAIFTASLGLNVNSRPSSSAQCSYRLSWGQSLAWDLPWASTISSFFAVQPKTLV